MTKTVCIAADRGFDPEYWFECSDVNLVGVNVDIYHDPGIDDIYFEFVQPDPALLVFQGFTGADGIVTLPLYPGEYILCVYEDPSGAVTTTEGDPVTTDLPPQIDFLFECIVLHGERFTVEPGVYIHLVNEAIPEWLAN